MHAVITFSTQTSFEGFFGVQCVENLFAPLFLTSPLFVCLFIDPDEVRALKVVMAEVGL